MSKKSVPERITLTEKDLDGLVSRLEANELSDDDVSILKDVLLFSDWMQDSLSKKELTIAKLRNLFGIKTEKKSVPYRVMMTWTLPRSQNPLHPVAVKKNNPQSPVITIRQQIMGVMAQMIILAVSKLKSIMSLFLVVIIALVARIIIQYPG